VVKSFFGPVKTVEAFVNSMILTKVWNKIVHRMYILGLNLWFFATRWRTNRITFQLYFSSIVWLRQVPFTVSSFSIFDVTLSSNDVMINTEIWNKVIFWMTLVFFLRASCTRANRITWFLIIKLHQSVGSSSIRISVRTCSSGFWDNPVSIVILYRYPCMSKSSFLRSNSCLSVFDILVNTKVRYGIVKRWSFTWLDIVPLVS
jgi:hypothetical protein